MPEIVHRVLGIQAAQLPTHYEWGPSPQVNYIDPPDVAEQQGR
jgi:hypothetical protein